MDKQLRKKRKRAQRLMSYQVAVKRSLVENRLEDFTWKGWAWSGVVFGSIIYTFIDLLILIF